MDPAMILAILQAMRLAASVVDTLAAGNTDPTLKAQIDAMHAHLKDANDAWDASQNV